MRDTPLGSDGKKVGLWMVMVVIRYDIVSQLWIIMGTMMGLIIVGWNGGTTDVSLVWYEASNHWGTQF